MELGEIARRRARRRLYRYQPYPKQYEFHAAGAAMRERLVMAGNRLGKTLCAGFEVAMHATGWYPDWWPGRRFDKPTSVWTGAETNELSKNVTQKILLGVADADMRSPDFGTGALPHETIKKVYTRQAGIKDVADVIVVRHATGRWSQINLKTYEQGRLTWQGAAVDVVWNDEEPPPDIYSEGVTRTMDTDGIVFTTFTPLRGMSEVVKRFLQPAPGDPPRQVTAMTLADVVGGVWPEGTPWAGREWEGHYTADQIAEIEATYPEHERKTRALGVPMMGEGLVYPVADEEIAVDPFPIPRHWPRLGALDFGWDHPTAAVWGAWDRDTDTIYIYDCYRKSNAVIAIHAEAIRSRDPQGYIPIVWPHDGMKKDPKSGRPMWKLFRDHEVNMYRDSARVEDAIGGAQPIEPTTFDILERMQTGRFKVFRSCGAWFEEKRLYHRKDGKIVDVNEDLMSATRYFVMMLRKARVFIAAHRPRARYAAPVIGGR
jgi:phage terminase large subunit-like protein